MGDRQKDKDFVAKLVSEVNGDPTAIKEVFRMGQERSDKKPRPLKVICDSVWTKRSLLTGQQRLRENYPELKGSGFFARDDMTQRQWDADKALREQLKVYREQNPNIAKSLVIRDGKIVQKHGKETHPFPE